MDKWVLVVLGVSLSLRGFLQLLPGLSEISWDVGGTQGYKASATFSKNHELHAEFLNNGFNEGKHYALPTANCQPLRLIHKPWEHCDVGMNCNKYSVSSLPRRLATVWMRLILIFYGSGIIFFLKLNLNKLHFQSACNTKSIFSKSLTFLGW